MNKNWLNFIATELGIKEWQVENTFLLYSDDCTVPFVARYRKEKTGNLDEVTISILYQKFSWIKKFEARKQYILQSIEKQNALTDELKNEIENCYDENILEDIYLPFKPKKKTKASKAKENGLEPLAQELFLQQKDYKKLHVSSFITDSYPNETEVVRGAKDIVVEWITENKDARNIVRNQFEQYSTIVSNVIKTKKEEAEKYKLYFNYKEKLSSCPAHRFLALMRGKEEGFLRVRLEINDEHTLYELMKLFVKKHLPLHSIVKECVEEAYFNYILPAIENEFFKSKKQKADIESIRVFSENLKQLLLTPPLGEKRILAIDPGYRTGCKLVCLDEQGQLLHNETIYPHPPQNERQKAEKKIISLVDAYKIDCIAVGDGTASRETEQMLSRIKFSRPIKIYVVSEAGASVYSASDIARQEFPQFDVTVRGAVSIGRRLQDPLSELVKIDPKTIGVGQYQHDVDQQLLKESLENTVVECVNKVGVKLNTATYHLLRYVSGIGEKTAQAIVEYRTKHGRFQSIFDLMNIPKIKEKTFQQAAGFLRIENGINLLDNTGIHPEHYPLVERIAKDLNVEIKDLIENEEILKNIDLKKYCNNEIGEETLKDIIHELSNPGYDVRLKVKVLEFSPDVHTFEDLKIGMVLNGIITNITNFGAFVNIGIKESGLVHISQISNEFIQNPLEKLHLHQHVKVKVIGIDENLRRFQLSIKDANSSN